MKKKKSPEDWDCEDYAPTRGWRHGPLEKTCEWIEERDYRNIAARGIPVPFWNRKLRIELVPGSLGSTKQPGGAWKVNDTTSSYGNSIEEMAQAKEVLAREGGPKYAVTRYISRNQVIWIAHVVYDMQPEDAGGEWTAKELDRILDLSLKNPRNEPEPFNEEIDEALAQFGSGKKSSRNGDGPNLDELFPSDEDEIDFLDEEAILAEVDTESELVWAADFVEGQTSWELDFR